MKIILLSGGSGKRLWPLSNDARSKQFLRLLTAPDGSKESMIQRMVRQIKSAELTDDIVIATGLNQKDSIENQLGDSISVVTEPCRRDTFPAIMLACTYLADQGTSMDEPVIVMPCDSYTDCGYFTALAKMADAVCNGVADMVLMGIQPAYPSAKYGYIVPKSPCNGGNAVVVKRFTEKPDVATAKKLIEEGALWNGGVFAFGLGYLMDIVHNVRPGAEFNSLRADYANLPKISFDYAVVEKAQSVAVVPYSGEWKDLGTWNTLTDELDSHAYGNVHAETTNGTYIINELEIPVVCIGTKDLVIAASPDGILVSERKLSENLKYIVDGISKRPMYEERRWGEYRVVDYVEFPDGFCALTKQITLRPGCSISYQKHNCREEIWTFINGEGEIVLDGERILVKCGDVITISRGMLHALRAITSLTFIEVQHGNNLIEEDIERFNYVW
ncbi:MULTISPECIES: sugar phosphate nucleotidyltransferase [Bacteroidales]|jgi:mannose-1-phosphate guanylyltransferase|uniref:sugar phosphate nucleotidyltransferase n=1 Tax=Bacteroidales TaxID=171549 RepID=UPI0025582615|nr:MULTISPECIES: sugar phosphate nucleotidyltransferase [Bacteroidales]